MAAVRYLWVGKGSWSAAKEADWGGGWLVFDACNGARVEHVKVARLLDAVPARQGGRACVSQPIKRVEALLVPRNWGTHRIEVSWSAKCLSKHEEESVSVEHGVSGCGF